MHMHLPTYLHTHTHTHTMDCYSAIKKNKIMLFAATWIDLEIVTLSEMSDTERQISCDIACMWDLRRRGYE